MKMSKEREPEKGISETSKGEEEDDDYSSEDTDSEHSAPPPAARKPRTTGQTQSVIAKNPTTPSIPKPATPVPSPQDTDSETESEPETDSVPDSEEYIENPKEKGNGKAAAAAAAGSTRKKPTDDEIEAEDRRPNKMRKKQAQASEKKPAFQRIWSEADELAVLRGIVEFRDEKKQDPAAKVDSFLDFIQKNLHIEVSRNQLKDKIRRMKKKFTNNKNNGRSFKNQHEQQAHALAQKAWGSEIENWDKTANENGREMVQTRAKTSGDQGSTIEEKQKMKVIIEELKVYSRKVEIKAKQFDLLLQKMKSARF